MLMLPLDMETLADAFKDDAFAFAQFMVAMSNLHRKAKLSKDWKDDYNSVLVDEAANERVHDTLIMLERATIGDKEA